MYAFFGGMITMGFVVSGLFFLRFWHRTGDGLFVAFAVAFWLLALQRALISIPSGPSSKEGLAFLPSLVAFGLLILAILAKNFDRSNK